MKNKIDYLILISIVILELSSIFFLSQAIKKNTAKYLETKTKLLAFENKGASLVNLQKDYDIVKDNLQIIDLVLPNKEGIVDFLSELEKSASSAGVLAKINFSGQQITNESANVKSIKLNLTIKGTYFSIIQFIKNIEAMPQVVFIDKTIIQLPKGIEAENNAILYLRCYISPEF